jgi:hypothetical protein
MSADNGIYILKMKDQSRVIHTQAIENLWWDYTVMETTDHLVSTRIVEYYGHAKPMTNKEAIKEALRLENEILNDDFCSVLEYGISIIEIDKAWDEIIQEAKELVKLEIEHIKSLPDWNRKSQWYKEEIKNLKKMIR